MHVLASLKAILYKAGGVEINVPLTFMKMALSLI